MQARKKVQVQSSLWAAKEADESIRQYIAVFGDVLNPKQKELLIGEIAEKRITKVAWADALANWKLCGYSPRNIAGMIEYACARPAGNRGPVVRTQAEEQPEPDIESVVVRPPKRTFEWDT